jgi:hypothetical protein
MKLLASIALVFLTTAAAHAQTLDFAWLVSAGAGLAAHDNGAFSRRLKSYTPVRASGENFIYQTRDFSSTGTTLNGHVGFLLGERWFVGASGEAVGYPTMHSINGPGNPRDDYDLSAIEGGLDLGYALVNDRGMLIYPYLHASYASYSLDYTNNQNEAIPFFEGKPVDPGTTATYTGSAPRWALGVGMTKLVGVDGDNSTFGLVVGARLTWGMMIARPEWHEPDGSVVNNGGLTPGYNGVSLSISVGLGGS